MVETWRYRTRETNRRRRWNPLNQYSAIAPTLAHPLAYPLSPPPSRQPASLPVSSFTSVSRFRSFYATLRATPVTLSKRNFSGSASMGYSQRVFSTIGLNSPLYVSIIYPMLTRCRWRVKDVYSCTLHIYNYFVHFRLFSSDEDS